MPDRKNTTSLELNSKLSKGNTLPAIVGQDLPSVGAKACGNREKAERDGLDPY